MLSAWILLFILPMPIFLFLFFKDLFTIRERGKRGRETSVCERYIDWLPLACPQLGTWPATQACALTGDWTSDLAIHRPALNPLNHTSQGNNANFKCSIRVFNSYVEPPKLNSLHSVACTHTCISFWGEQWKLHKTNTTVLFHFLTRAWSVNPLCLRFINE